VGHALAIEPKSAELNMFMAYAQEEAGRADAALWYTMLTTYLASQRPRRVDWEPVDALERVALPERLLLAPAALSPANPCWFTRGILSVLRRELPSLERRALALRLRHERRFVSNTRDQGAR
jgi:hypothetical protein